MAHLILELQDEYRRIFGGSPYVLPSSTSAAPNIPSPYSLPARTDDDRFTPRGSLMSENINGVEVWLPVRLSDPDLPDGGIYLPYSVVRIDSRKRIVKTPLSEGRGTVKELYAIEDISISIKGFLISPDRQFPEAELVALKRLYELNRAVVLDNALTDVFLVNEGREKDKVVLEDLQIPEVEGGRKHVRPFSLKCESDTVFTLEVEPQYYV